MRLVNFGNIRKTLKQKTQQEDSLTRVCFFHQIFDMLPTTKKLKYKGPICTFD
jgi:hypothetical protein